MAQQTLSKLFAAKNSSKQPQPNEIFPTKVIPQNLIPWVEK